MLSPKRQEGCKEEDGLNKESYEWQVEEAINTPKEGQKEFCRSTLRR